MKRLFIIGLTAVLILSGCANQDAAANVKSNIEPEETSVETPVYYLAGKIQASSAADLSAPFSGRIESLPVKVGESVKAGDALVIFDASDLKAQAQVAQMSYEIAVANLEKAKTGARPEQIKQIEASFESAKANLDNAKSTLDRNEALYQTGSVSMAQLEVVRTQFSAADANYQSVEEQLAMVKNGETKAFMAVLEKQVLQAKASLEATQVALENRTLKAPFDGIVIACPANVGESYSSMTSLISLENRDGLTVDAYGPVSAIGRFKVGQTVKVKVAEIPDQTFSGTVTWIGDTIDPKRRTVLTKVSLESTDALMVGMFTEIGMDQ